MVDKAVVERRLLRLENSLNKLRELSQCSRAEYEEDEALQDRAERNLQIAIQVCIDIASHLAASLGFRSPESYTDLFTVLGERDLLEDELCSTMKLMVGLRNILVHDYLDIKPRLIYKNLKQLDDFRAFAEAVERILQQHAE